MRQTERAPVLTLDGPGGTGKGTVGRLVAERLQWHYLDSGAIYRAFAVMANDSGIIPDDAPTISEFARGLDLRLDAGGVPGRVVCNGRDVSREIGSETCGDLASRYASIPEVREALLVLQRDQRMAPGLVADGRDMGTRVFPDAEVKIYLDASLDVRVQRRYKQLMEKGLDGSLARLREEMAARDARDASRSASPMMTAPDAIPIDTSDMSIGEVVEEVLGYVAARVDPAAVPDRSRLRPAN